MSGPVPGATGRNPAAVAEVARAAHAVGRSMTDAVASRYGITPEAARQAIYRARKLGEFIPSDRNSQHLTAPPDLPPTPAPTPAPFRRDLAACRGATGFMYPSDARGVPAAKAVCAGCPVRAECLEFALANDERWGVWGGTSERQRRAMRAVRVRERRVAEMSAA